MSFGFHDDRRGRDDPSDDRRGGGGFRSDGNMRADRYTPYRGGKGRHGDDEGGYRQPATGTRVYVHNLSWSTSWQNLKDHFRDAGDVVHAKVMTGQDGRSKGCGIVEFSSKEDAENAIATLHDSDLDGRPIIVREDREDYMGSGGPIRGGKGGEDFGWGGGKGSRKGGKGKGGAKGGKGGKGGRKGEDRPQKSEDELMADMDNYFKKRPEKAEDDADVDEQ